VSCEADLLNPAVSTRAVQVAMNSDPKDLLRMTPWFPKQRVAIFYGWRVSLWRRNLLNAVKISSARAINKVTKITIR
jgi:hypothetical protein